MYTLHTKSLLVDFINLFHHFHFIRFTLDIVPLYFSKAFGIEVYLYTKGNIIIPMEISGLYGSI